MVKETVQEVDRDCDIHRVAVVVVHEARESKMLDKPAELLNWPTEWTN